jgi:3-methylcrotonyl-CoA carboxylase alpha subunit
VKTAWRDGDRVRSVVLSPLGGGHYRVQVDDVPFDVHAEAMDDGRMLLRTGAGDTVAEVTVAGGRRFVRLGTLDFVLEREAAQRPRAAGPQHGLSAPMNGVITRVLVEADDDVVRGQPLVALEAMKMEHLVRAPRDGRVKAVHGRPGDMVQGGTTLVELHPEVPA